MLYLDIQVIYLNLMLFLSCAVLVQSSYKLEFDAISILCCTWVIKLYTWIWCYFYPVLYLNNKLYISITVKTLIFLSSAYASFFTKLYSCVVYLCCPPGLEAFVEEFSSLVAFLPNTWGLTPSRIKHIERITIFENHIRPIIFPGHLKTEIHTTQKYL